MGIVCGFVRLRGVRASPVLMILGFPLFVVSLNSLVPPFHSFPLFIRPGQKPESRRTPRGNRQCPKIRRVFQRRRYSS